VACSAAAVLLLAACGGGSGGSRLSASQYRAQLTKIKQQAADAQSNVAQGLQARTVSELQSRLDVFAAATRRIGDEVAKLKAPENAEAANTELAQGLHETAHATHAASAAVAKLKSPQEAISYLQHSAANQKGAHDVNDALTKLKKLGYTTGS
jgi:hypothetical protein